jgi:hypothetical protein
MVAAIEDGHLLIELEFPPGGLDSVAGAYPLHPTRLTSIDDAAPPSSTCSAVTCTGDEEGNSELNATARYLRQASDPH